MRNELDPLCFTESGLSETNIIHIPSALSVPQFFRPNPMPDNCQRTSVWLRTWVPQSIAFCPKYKDCVPGYRSPASGTCQGRVVVEHHLCPVHRDKETLLILSSFLQHEVGTGPCSHFFESFYLLKIPFCRCGRSLWNCSWTTFVSD
jgi:hypothetical protein